MSHTIRKKRPLLQRVARIRGQLDAVTRALEAEAECGDVLQLIASARGALNGLMAEVLEEHVRLHTFGSPGATDKRAAADEVVGVIRSYLR